MAGFWHLSSTTIFDQIARPASGAQAFFYPADTLVQLVVYKDSALTVPWSQPVEADGWGRMPNVYLDDSAASFYRFRITDSTGVELIALATIPIIGSAAGGGGGGGGGAVDSTSVLNTGDMWFSPMQGVRAGAVRANGRTIGNALSGGSERANADTQALFLFLYGNLADGVCPVSGGRTGNAATDYAANKRIGLPDLRGRAPFGLDGMGTGLAGVIVTGVIANNDTPGSSGGSSSHIISVGEMPTHLHGVGTIAAANESAHTHGINFTSGAGSAHSHGPGTFAISSHTHGVNITSGAESTTHVHNIGIGNVAGGANAAAMTANSANVGTFQTGTNNGSHTHSVAGNTDATQPTLSGSSATESAHTHAIVGTSAAGSAHTHSLSGSTANAGLNTPMINLSPAFLGTWFVKL